MTEIGYNKATLLEMLRNRIVEVKFEKTDGSIRVLRGTLKEDLLPLQKNKTDRNTNLDLEVNMVTVWDLDAKGWRSFHTDKVIKVL